MTNEESVGQTAHFEQMTMDIAHAIIVFEKLKCAVHEFQKVWREHKIVFHNYHTPEAIHHIGYAGNYRVCKPPVLLCLDHGNRLEASDVPCHTPRLLYLFSVPAVFPSVTEHKQIGIFCLRIFKETCHAHICMQRSVIGKQSYGSGIVHDYDCFVSSINCSTRSLSAG